MRRDHVSLGPRSADRSTNPSQGIDAERFRARFGGFTFTCEYGDQRTFKKQFGKKEVDALIRDAERTNRAALEAAAESLRR
jgi:hypothetical protein